VPTTIRLTRMGRKKRPFYRLVVLDSRKRRDGAYLANLGYYNPFQDPHQVELHAPEIIDWLKKGATMSETARSLLRREGILYRYSLVQKGMEEAEIEAKMAEWTASAEKKEADRLASIEAKAKAKAEAEAKALKEAEEAKKAEEEAARKAEEEAARKAEEEAAAAAAAEAAETAEAQGEEAAEEAAAEEAPAEEAPAEEAPAEEAPAEEEEK
jgi:small subunit ribosomal protein S16